LQKPLGFLIIDPLAEDPALSSTYGVPWRRRGRRNARRFVPGATPRRPNQPEKRLLHRTVELIDGPTPSKVSTWWPYKYPIIRQLQLADGIMGKSRLRIKSHWRPSRPLFQRDKVHASMHVCTNCQSKITIGCTDTDWVLCMTSSSLNPTGKQKGCYDIVVLWTGFPQRRKERNLTPVFLPIRSSDLLFSSRTLEQALREYIQTL